MAVSVVQKAVTSEFSAASASISLPSNVTVGNVAIVNFTLYSNDGGSNEIDAAASNPCVDNATTPNSYSPIATAEVKQGGTWAHWYQHCYWYMANITHAAASTFTVTGSFSRSTYGWVGVYELTPCQFDKAITGTGTVAAGGTNQIIGNTTITPSANGAVLLSSGQLDGGNGAAPAWIAVSPWTIDLNTQAGGGMNWLQEATQATAALVNVQAQINGTATASAIDGLQHWLTSGLSFIPPGTVWQGQANLAGAGVLTDAGVVTYAAAVALAGTGALSETAQLLLGGQTTLAGVGSLSQVAQLVLGGQAQLQGAAVFNTAGVMTYAGAVTLAGLGTLLATPGSAALVTLVLSDESVTTLLLADEAVTTLILKDG